MDDDEHVLNQVIDNLLCPVCGAGLLIDGAVLRCTSGHAYDIARQGYVNLLPGDARPGTADTPEMVRARETFLGAGHLGSLKALLAERVHEMVEIAKDDTCLLDAGAGTGYYLTAVLGRLPAVAGIALDLSKHALRRAARAHPRIGAVVWDIWRPLPVRDASMAAVLNVFAPRNAAEFRRVLAPQGTLFVVTPTARHLATLIKPLGLLTVDQRKTERMDAVLDTHFFLESRESHEIELTLSHREVEVLVRMGPSAWHVSSERLQARLACLVDPLPVPISYTLSVFRHRR